MSLTQFIKGRPQSAIGNQQHTSPQHTSHFCIIDIHNAPNLFSLCVRVGYVAVGRVEMEAGVRYDSP